MKYFQMQLEYVKYKHWNNFNKTFLKFPGDNLIKKGM